MVGDCAGVDQFTEYMRHCKKALGYIFDSSNPLKYYTATLSDVQQIFNELKMQKASEQDGTRAKQAEEVNKAKGNKPSL